jgi:hypothetical protein
MRYFRALRTDAAIAVLAAIVGSGPVSAQEGGRSGTTTAIRVVEDLRIGKVDGERPYLFGSITNVIPDASGRIWVMDGQNSELRLFDATGRFVRSIGRRGQGPGEFGENACAHPGPNGEIWVLDPQQNRWTRFDPDGKLLGTLAITHNTGCTILTWTPDGRLMASNNSPVNNNTGLRQAYYVVQRFNAGRLMATGDTIQRPRLSENPTVTWVKEGASSQRVALPLANLSTYRLGPEGDFWVADGGGPYVIRRLGPNGATRVTFRRDYEPVPVADSTRSRLIKEFRREPRGYRAEDGFNPNQVPHTYPAFERFYPATDGSVWVKRTLAGGRVGYDVFAANGRYEGEAQLPQGFGDVEVEVITTDRIYGVISDALGVKYVVRFAIRRAGL